MTERDENTQRWIETWRRAAPELERIRREEMNLHDTPYYVASFGGVYAFTCSQYPTRLDSGLVEQQRLFMKAHNA